MTSQRAHRHHFRTDGSCACGEAKPGEPAPDSTGEDELTDQTTDNPDALNLSQEEAPALEAGVETQAAQIVVENRPNQAHTCPIHGIPFIRHPQANGTVLYRHGTPQGGLCREEEL